MSFLKSKLKWMEPIITAALTSIIVLVGVFLQINANEENIEKRVKAELDANIKSLKIEHQLIKDQKLWESQDKVMNELNDLLTTITLSAANLTEEILDQSITLSYRVNVYFFNDTLHTHLHKATLDLATLVRSRPSDGNVDRKRVKKNLYAHLVSCLVGMRNHLYPVD